MIDTYLTFFVLASMAIGVSLGFIPQYTLFLEAITINHYNIILTLCLIGMIYPSLISIKYTITTISYKLFILSFIQNWIIGPFLMYGLAKLILSNPDYITGLLLVGIARFIAMVLVWIDMANGDMDNAFIIVAFNSPVTILCFICSILLLFTTKYSKHKFIKCIYISSYLFRYSIYFGYCYQVHTMEIYEI